MLEDLFRNNLSWVERITANDPEFFTRLAKQQAPEFLWIGCSDSRVPANEIMGLLPGEVFVHRNVANLVIHTDMNCLSVLQYAIEVLKVKHILVTGHYGCGGVQAALDNREFGLIDNWLRNLKDIYRLYEKEFEGLDDQERLNLLCELNVVEQVANVCHTTFVQSAWKRGQELSVHGFIFSIENGVLQDLGVNVSAQEGLSPIYRMQRKSELLRRKDDSDKND